MCGQGMLQATCCTLLVVLCSVNLGICCASSNGMLFCLGGVCEPFLHVVMTTYVGTYCCYANNALTAAMPSMFWYGSELGDSWHRAWARL